MLVNEFKAWFDGFTEQMTKPPTATQWKRIKARVKQIDDAPVTEYVYRDYFRPYYAHFSSEPQKFFGATTMGQNQAQTIDSAVMMNDAGRAEFASL